MRNGETRVEMVDAAGLEPVVDILEALVKTATSKRRA